MIIQELAHLADEQRQQGRGDAYILNALKEYLQAYVLYFIYTSAEYKQKLIFTGGTCLRHCYGLERLSEDIDFDTRADCSVKKLLEDLKDFFNVRYQYPDVRASLKQQDSRILLKFPVLSSLHLTGARGSDLLYVKIDVSPIPSTHYSLLTTSHSLFGFNYAAKHYDLPALMAGKLHAILTRSYRKGKENRPTIKGRDYFDLLWFLKAGVHPDVQRLSEMLAETLDIKTVERRLDEKVAVFIQKHKGDYIADMAPLMKEPDILETYTDSYQEEYVRLKARSFAQSVTLYVRCRQCRAEFGAGISVEATVFAGLALDNNTHRCPFCNYANVVRKSDYVIK